MLVVVVSEMRSQLVPLALAYVRARGGDADQLRQQFDLPVDAETIEEVRLPLRTLHAVLEAASELAGDPWLGCSLVASRRTGAHGLIEYAWRSAETVAEGLRIIARFSAVMNQLSTIDLVVDGERARFLQRWPDPDGAGRHANEFFVAMFVAQTRALTDRAFLVHRALFAHARPSLDLAHLRAAVATDDLVFSADVTGIEFAREMLDWKLRTADPVLRDALAAHSAARVEPQFTTDVRDAIRRSLPDGPPSLATIAKLFGIGARTLQRRLADHETSLNRLIDAVREEEARRAVRSDASLDEIAGRLGYSDATTFVRAFRRWTGTTPGRFRKSE